MLRDQIFKKGLLNAPENLEIDVLLYAAQEINSDTETEISEYLSWIPFAGMFFILKDLLTGQNFRITPEFKI